MFYIIGGAPRAGKTLLAKRIFAEKQIPYFPLDSLVGSSAFSANNTEITHDMHFQEKSERVWEFTEHLFKYFLKNKDNYIVEGYYLLPNHLQKYLGEHTHDFRICYLGYTEITPEEKLLQVRNFYTHENDWTLSQSDEILLPKLDRMIAYSKYIKDECNKNNILYFDTSYNFIEVQEEVYSYLMV